MALRIDIWAQCFPTSQGPMENIDIDLKHKAQNCHIRCVALLVGISNSTCILGRWIKSAIIQDDCSHFKILELE